MTEVSTEPVAVEPATPPPTPETTPRPHQAIGPAELDHTPGGWPVVPLATAGTNSTIGMVATAALAGGPVAAAIAMTGAVVLGTAAVARTSRRDQRTPRKQTAGRTPSRSASTGGAGSQRRGGVPSQSRNGNAGTTSRGRSKPRTGMGTHAGPAARSGKHRQAAPGARNAEQHRTARHVGKGRVGQVRALRADKQNAAPTRAANRAQTTAARRGVADARRAAKSAARSAHAPTKGRVGRALARGAGKGRNALVNKAREAKDQRTGQSVAAKRSAVRKAPARMRARRALWRSAARMQGRRLVAALLGGALGIVGLFTTPLGRKLGIRWLQYPGRRLYRRLLGQARLEKAERDAAIRQTQDAEEAAADAEAESDLDEIKDQIERPAHTVPTAPSPTFAEEATHVSGFNFEETAAEMESAAHSYEPDGCMEILAMVESLPAALLSIANTMQILAERSDSEFPMEKEVAGGLTDIYNALMYAVSAAEDLGPLFRQVHEQDIARHEDPRNGPEAEKGWNV